jgi:hypothetical protein
MVSAKIMWNSVISTPGNKFDGADIKNMYLETPLDQYMYMCMPLKLFPMTSLPTTAYAKKALNKLRLYGNTPRHVGLTPSRDLSQ